MTVFIVRPDGPATVTCGVLLRPGRTVRIGRNSDNDICFKDLRLSRYHFEIRHEGDRVRMWNCNTTCGTRINDVRCGQEAELQVGDRVGFAPSLVRLEVAPNLDASWLSWHGGTVKHLAQDAEREKSVQLLPKLADALEDAGCTDAEMLGHLRAEGPHVRGCWAVDLLLGKG
jgi:pSer/pThr/pTyr-binding forkhead associated (FHA) protein